MNHAQPSNRWSSTAPSAKIGPGALTGFDAAKLTELGGMGE
jgi:hypothetical protein